MTAKIPVPAYYLRKLDDEKIARIKLKRLTKQKKREKTLLAASS